MRCDELFEIDIINESKMSELAHLLDDIRKLSSAIAQIDFDNERIMIRFMLYDRPGRIELHPLTENKFRSKIYAAAMAMNNGNRLSWDMVSDLVNGRINHQAIKILTNPSVWSITGLDYDSFKF
jgi:hypothetical protein